MVADRRHRYLYVTESKGPRHAEVFPESSRRQVKVCIRSAMEDLAVVTANLTPARPQLASSNFVTPGLSNTLAGRQPSISGGGSRTPALYPSGGVSGAIDCGRRCPEGSSVLFAIGVRSRAQNGGPRQLCTAPCRSCVELFRLLRSSSTTPGAGTDPWARKFRVAELDLARHLLAPAAQNWTSSSVVQASPSFSTTAFTVSPRNLSGTPAHGYLGTCGRALLHLPRNDVEARGDDDVPSVDRRGKCRRPAARCRRCVAGHPR